MPRVASLLVTEVTEEEKGEANSSQEEDSKVGDSVSDYLFLTTIQNTLVKPQTDLPLGDDVPADLEEPLVTTHKENLKEGLRGSRLEEAFLESDAGLTTRLGGCQTIEEERNEIRKALAEKSKQTGISQWVLRLVFNRGKRAWAKSESWNDTNSVQWGLARVNSFCCGGKFRQADRDLWLRHKEMAGDSR